jgi:hypothetical protein
MVAYLLGNLLEHTWSTAVIRRQQPDGWPAWDFHGNTSTESGIHYFARKESSRISDLQYD